MKASLRWNSVPLPNIFGEQVQITVIPVLIRSRKF